MKPNDVLLAEYLLLKQEIKTLEARVSEINGQIKEYGSFATKSFVASVNKTQRRSLVSLQEGIDRVGLAALERFDLIKTTEVITVVVSKKL